MFSHVKLKLLASQIFHEFHKFFLNIFVQWFIHDWSSLVLFCLTSVVFYLIIPTCRYFAQHKKSAIRNIIDQLLNDLQFLMLLIVFRIINTLLLVL